jgi:muramoyltetrapeptide carboxypeptidase
MRYWEPLQKGDIIDVVAPASKCNREDLNAAVEMIKARGFVARVPEKIFQPDLLFSSPDEARFKYLKEALYATDSKAIWCARGGYGSNRLLPQLAKLRRPKKSKIFVGLSDITSLHVFFNQEWNWPTIHGPMMDRLGRNTMPTMYVREVFDVVTGEESELKFDGLKPLNDAARKNKKISGPISGGNLTILATTLGTKFHWKPSGDLLFLEDIGERGYRVDRTLEHLRAAGVYRGVKAILFGDFTEGLEPDGSDRVPEVLKAFAQSMDIPVLKGIKSGHDVIQRPVPFGTIATLMTGAKPKLSVATGVYIK